MMQEPNFVPGPALDYSFMELENLGECLDEEPRTGVLSQKSRLRVKEEKDATVAKAAGQKKKKKAPVPSRYKTTQITTCLRVCNNSLQNLDGLDECIEETMDYPEKLEWFDFSFNQLTTIDEVRALSSAPGIRPAQHSARVPAPQSRSPNRPCSLSCLCL